MPQWNKINGNYPLDNVSFIIHIDIYNPILYDPDACERKMFILNSDIDVATSHDLTDYKR